MVVPKVMVWAFEGNAEAMEEHCKALEEVNTFASGLESSLSRDILLNESRKAMTYMARAVQAGLTCLNDSKNTTKLEAALNLISAVGQSIQDSLQPAVSASVLKMNNSERPLLIDLQQLSVISRFLRVDAYFFGT